MTAIRRLVAVCLARAWTPSRCCQPMYGTKRLPYPGVGAVEAIPANEQRALRLSYPGAVELFIPVTTYIP